MLRNYLAYSDDWFALLNKKKDLVDLPKCKVYIDFLFSWLSLIFLGKNEWEDYSKRHNEPELIKNLITKVSEQEQIINDFFDKNLLKIQELSELRVKNVKREHYNEAEDLIEKLKTDNKFEILNSLVQLLYVVRCNLFHADKSWDDTNDTEVVTKTVNVLIPLLESLRSFY